MIGYGAYIAEVQNNAETTIPAIVFVMYLFTFITVFLSSMALLASANYFVLNFLVLLFGLCVSLLIDMIWDEDYRNLNPFVALTNAFFVNYLIGDLLS